MIPEAKLPFLGRGRLAAISEALETAWLRWMELSPEIRQGAEGLSMRVKLEAAASELELLQSRLIPETTPVPSPRTRAGGWQKFG